MTEMRILNKRILITLSLILMLVMGSVQSMYAEGIENGHMPDLSRDSTLKIRMQYTDEDVTKPIQGTELTIYKVADLTVENGVAKYASTSDFASADVDYKNLNTTASADMEAAEKFYGVVKSNGSISGAKKVTDENGIADFGQVKNGIYLVVQTGASGDAEDYTEIKPYLVMAPLPMQNNEEYSWNYDVESIPKMEVENNVVKLTKTINGEDSVEVTHRKEKFSYEIVGELTQAPENFAIVDNVPEELMIVDEHRIVVKVNGEKLDKALQDSMVKIDGNMLRVEFNKKQIEDWYPLAVDIQFFCRFRDDVEITDENQSVINKAGYEVLADYYEPPGDKHQAEVKGVFKDEAKVKGASTGDYAQRVLYGLAIAVLVSTMIIAIILRRRRKADSN